MSQPQTRAAVRKRPFILAGVMLAGFMSAIEATIVATAMPSIVADLGGFAVFSWVFSGYLLMQAITIPIYGKLADLYGRKPVFAIGVLLFLIGSIACGFSQSMTALILFRMLQGLGAGAVQPISTTIVGDIYTMEERGKIQGYLASVWGVSSVIGPALGGFFVQFTHWAWVFWMNVPIGILSLLLIVFFLKEEVKPTRRQVDYAGSLLLFVSVGALMLLLIGGGSLWSWTSWPIGVLAVLFAAGFTAFLFQEKRAPEPMMPLYLWKRRIISTANAAAFTTGALLIGLSTFLPTYVQGVMDRSPTVAGFTLAVMSIGWSLAATLGGRWVLRIGFRRMAVAGGILLTAGSVFFLLMKPDYGPLFPGIGSFILGIGMGLTATTFIVSIQNSVQWTERGVATASHMFMRILGNTVGAALLGGLLNSRMTAYLAETESRTGLSLHLDLANDLLDPVKKAALDPQLVSLVQEGLVVSLHNVYWGVFGFACLSLLLVLLFPSIPVGQKGPSASPAGTPEGEQPPKGDSKA
ncbi:MFS transporter [Paenibacillus sp. J31TS4]|uniref:MDR family MFS transporter n=1 Tax=Paenibacillus sp. J31TS4 TaxID=2807195 RepID=UPI001B27BE12|nr:MDR family MFS transporter [Paenibacillus sp. J31TS4]GIP40918.1 MFS transporter [Paenibacillus sp. J31TS4]